MPKRKQTPFQYHISFSSILYKSSFSAPASIDSLIDTEKLAMEGKVVQKLECRPTGIFIYNLCSLNIYSTFILFQIPKLIQAT
jgi:hypothetical protein